jgi:DNA-binding protein H-NS
MALNDTIKNVRNLLANITQDLEKADNGNKAAAQRVRTGTVKLEKIAKLYRKESIKNEKGTKKTGKKAAPKAKKAAKKAPAKHAAPAKKAAAKHVAKKAPAKHAPAKKAVVKAKPKAKAHNAKAHHAKARALSFKKKATAKLPTRRAGAR